MQKIVKYLSMSLFHLLVSLLSDLCIPPFVSHSHFVMHQYEDYVGRVSKPLQEAVKNLSIYILKTFWVIRFHLHIFTAQRRV